MSIDVGLPPASRRVTAKRRQVLERLVAQAAEAMATMQPQTLEHFARQLREQPGLDKRGAKFVEAVTRGKSYTPAESAALQSSALISSYNKRRELLGDSFSTNEVAQVLNVSRQTPNDRAKAGTLLAVHENGALRFPAWQFDPEGENGVVPGLDEVLQALEASPLGKVSWMGRPNRDLRGQRPIDVLRRRDVGAVLAAARLVGVN